MSLLLLFQGGGPAAAFTSIGWFAALSGAPHSLPVAQSELRPFGVQQVAAVVAPQGWQGQTSQAAPRPPVQLGSTFVPLNTTQVAVTPPAGWLAPLSQSVAKPPTQQGASVVPLRDRFVVEYGWQPRLTVAVAARQAPQSPTCQFVVQLPAGAVATEGWQRPLSTAAPQPPVALGSTFVPLNTTQVAAADRYGWWQPASSAPPRLPAPQPELRPFGVQQVAGAVATEGWQAPLSRPAPQPPLQTGSTFVPFNTAQVVVAVYNAFQPLSQAVARPPVQPGQVVWVGQPLAGNNVTIDKWLQPLARAAARPPVQSGSSFVPFNTAQVVVTPAYGWHRPLEQAAVKPPPRPPRATVAIAYPLPDEEHFRWWRQLSEPVAIPRSAPAGFTSVPYNVTQVAAIAVYGWWQPASKAPPALPVVQPELRPFGLQQVAGAVATEGWQRPLSVAAPQPPVQQGSSFVPLDTRQLAAVYGGAFVPLSRAVDIPRAPLGFTSVPFNTAQIFPAVYGATYQPLSTAVPRPPVAQGVSFVPYNTVQLAAVNFSWGQSLSKAVERPPVQAGSTSVPLNTRQVNTQTIDKWLVPLSVARAIPYPAPQGCIAWVARPLAGNNVGWGNYQQPLSRPADRRPVWQGNSVVPFNTTQVVFNNTIDYSLYQQALSRPVPIPYTTFTAGYTFVPFDTTQVLIDQIVDTDMLQLPIDVILHGDQHYEMSGREWRVPPQKITQKTTVTGTKTKRLRGDMPSFTTKTDKKGYD